MVDKIIAGVFTNEEDLYHATSEAREKGVDIVDAYTPYPVHGLEEAMGLAPTRLGVVCFYLGLTGLLCALGFQSWASVANWPLNIGGKSFLALPALIPVTFEVTILFAALGTVLAFLIRMKLWPGKKPLIENLGATDDRFVLVLKTTEEKHQDVQDLLRQKHAENISEIEVAS